MEIVEAMMCERPHSPSVQICFLRQTQEIKMPKVVDGNTSSKTKIFDHPVLELTPQVFGLLGIAWIQNQSISTHKSNLTYTTYTKYFGWNIKIK
jgi:hypothetical protein